MSTITAGEQGSVAQQTVLEWFDVKDRLPKLSLTDHPLFPEPISESVLYARADGFIKIGRYVQYENECVWLDTTRARDVGVVLWAELPDMRHCLTERLDQSRISSSYPNPEC